MKCEPLEIPKYFSSSKAVTVYLKKLLGVEFEKRRTYRIGHGLLKKVLDAKNVRVEVVYRVIEEVKGKGNGGENYTVTIELNRYVSIVYAIVCRGEEHG